MSIQTTCKCEQIPKNKHRTCKDHIDDGDNKETDYNTDTDPLRKRPTEFYYDSRQ